MLTRTVGSAPVAGRGIVLCDQIRKPRNEDALLRAECALRPCIITFNNEDTRHVDRFNDRSRISDSAAHTVASAFMNRHAIHAA